MICFGKHYKKINKKMAAFGLAGILLLTNMQSIPYAGQIVQAATDYGLHNPVNTEADGSGTTTWDSIYFGHYLQEDTNRDGKVDENDEKQPIKWRVLSVNGNDAFLMADQGLDCQPYNETYTDVTWETCTLRSWLNGYDSSNNVDEKDYSSNNFINMAFTAGEQSAIQYSCVVNDDNPIHDTKGGNNTEDKIYLLSDDEVASVTTYGFPTMLANTVTREMKSTTYCQKRGADTSFLSDQVKNSSWWLRSPGSLNNIASSVLTDGWDSWYSNVVNTKTVAVRPVLHLNLSYSNLWSYAGRVSSDKRENIHDPQVAGDGTVTWDCVYFGNYLQEDTNGDGTVDSSDTKQPIKWRVLSVDGDDAFLMADQNLDRESYNISNDEVTWEKCTLRSWLNGYDASYNTAGKDYSGNNFINEAFSLNEQGAIFQTAIINENNPYDGTDGGEGTTDKVYLLSIADTTNRLYGFSSNIQQNSKTRTAVNTDYVKEKGEYTFTGGNGSWWLRSPGWRGRYAASLYGFGGTYSGNNGVGGYSAIRPVLHLNISMTSLWSYGGTVSAQDSSMAATATPVSATITTGGPNNLEVSTTPSISAALPTENADGVITASPEVKQTDVPDSVSSGIPSLYPSHKPITTLPDTLMSPTICPSVTPTPIPTEKPDEANHAFLMFTDKDWRWGNWYTRVCGGYGRDTVITGNGTYTVSIHKSDFPDISEVNNPANGANVFLVDIMGICDTQKFDASGMAISDVVVKCDGNEIKTDLSKMYEGDIEGKGNYFLEIRNEYGYGDGDFATKEEFDEMNPDFTFSDSLSVTFTITGIKEGKTPADAFETADGKSVVEAGGKRAQVADMPEITKQPGIVTYAPVTSVSPGKVSSPPKITSGTVTRNKTTASPKKTSTPSGKERKVSSYRAAAGYVKKSGYLLKKAVKLTWKAANGVDGYYIYRREGSAGEKKLATLSNGSDSSYEDSSVEPGKSYTYRILPYHVSETENVETGAYSSAKTIKIGTTLKKPKISAKVKGTKLTLGFVQAEGEKFETQYRWMNEKKWKKQTKIQGRLKKNINKKINAKGFMLRIRSYAVIDGKKKYSKWSAPVKIR